MKRPSNYCVGDNLDELKKLSPKSIQLCYFDPVYNTGRNFNDFDDRFESMEAYKTFMRPRIQEVHRVLKDTGTVVVHIEPRISHHLRYLLDEVFGEKNFMNEIVWQTGGNAKCLKSLNRHHDTIIVYAKKRSEQHFFPQYKPYGDEYRQKNKVKICEHHKKEYITTALHNSQPDVNPRPNLRYEWNGHHKQWYILRQKMKQLHDDHRLAYNSKGVPRIKRFLHEMEGVPIRDIWTDISNTQRGEKLDYATQKPIELLERIVMLYTQENDWVLDIFAGSGTTGRACIKLNRQYLLFDISKKGYDVFTQSVKKVKS